MRLKLLFIFILINISLFSQNSEKRVIESDSLMISVIGKDIFKNYFKLKDITDDYVTYIVEIDGEIFKSINLFFDSNGNLRSNKFLLRKHNDLSGFIQIKKLSPKMTFLKQFMLAKEIGLSKIDNFNVTKKNGTLYWWFFESYITDDRRNGCLSLKIDDNGNSVGEIESVEEFELE